MNKYTVFFAILLSLAVADARNYERSDSDADDSDEPSDFVKRARDRATSQLRHRRRSWQTNYGYDYPRPSNPYEPDNRRNYDQNQDYLPQILRLLDDIASYVRRPQPPPSFPQPIYIPYGVPYQIPQYCSCKTEDQNKPAVKPTEPTQLDNRFSGGVDDTNRIWGLMDSSEDKVNEDDGDGSRPISFVPIQPIQSPRRPPAQVDHGSSQAGLKQDNLVTEAPSFGAPAAPPPLPSMCDVFSLSCCTGTSQQQQQCFINVGCGITYNGGRGCEKGRLRSIIEAYSRAYAPVN